MLKATSRIHWDDAIYADVMANVEPLGVERALFRLRKQLPELVWNAAALEGNTFTMPEVRTLLDGVTVGGKSLAEHTQILNLSEAFNELHALVAAAEFSVGEAVSNRLHGIVAVDESLDAGMLRGQGSVQGDSGGVRLMNGGFVEFDPAADLPAEYAALLDSLAAFPDPREAALAYFCSATRSQFYFDGNKRTARLVASGLLMQAGFTALNIPHARRLEFNMALDELFSFDDATQLMGFLAECLVEGTVR